MDDRKSGSKNHKAVELDVKKAERNRALQKKIIIGDILWSLHRDQGTESYLIAVIEPHLRKRQRALFGLI